MANIPPFHANRNITVSVCARGGRTGILTDNDKAVIAGAVARLKAHQEARKASETMPPIAPTGIFAILAARRGS